MDELESGKDKIQKICEIIKSETIEPAKLQAQKIIERAEQKGDEIISQAKAEAARLLEQAGERLKKEQKLYENALKQACAQAKEGLRQEIENKLFKESLIDWVESHTAEPEVAAALIEALVKAIEKEGISADFSAFVPKAVPPEKVNAHLGRHILERLRGGEVSLGEFVGGVQLKLYDRMLTLDLSDAALVELLEKYVRKEFHAILFQTS